MSARLGKFLDDMHAPTELHLLLRRAQDEISGWRGEIQKDIEAWCSNNGFTPVQKATVLDLIEDLQKRGVKTFEGLGIKVTL